MELWAQVFLSFLITQCLGVFLSLLGCVLCFDIGLGMDGLNVILCFFLDSAVC